MAAQERRTVRDRGSPDPKVSSIVTYMYMYIVDLPLYVLFLKYEKHFPKM